MAGRRAGSDVSAKGLTYSQPAKYSVEVLRPEVTELDVRSQKVHADDLCIAENYHDLRKAALWGWKKVSDVRTKSSMCS